MPNTSASGGYLQPVGTQPIDDDALDDVFHDMVVGITGLAPDLVRPRWQPTVAKQPAAAVNWCAIGVVEEEPDANAVVVHDPNANGGAGQDNLRRNEKIKVLATFYGANAKQYAKMLRDGLSILQNLEAIKIELLAFITTDTIRAVPEQINNVWVRRYDLPMHFRRLVERSYSVESIATGDITLHVDDITETITVAP